MNELPRSTTALALAAFATLNALAWVACLRLVAGMLDVTAWPILLGTVAAVTGLAVPIAMGALAAPRTEGLTE